MSMMPARGASSSRASAIGTRREIGRPAHRGRPQLDADNRRGEEQLLRAERTRRGYRLDVTVLWRGSR